MNTTIIGAAMGVQHALECNGRNLMSLSPASNARVARIRAGHEAMRAGMMRRRDFYLDMMRPHERRFFEAWRGATGESGRAPFEAVIQDSLTTTIEA